MHWIAPSEKDSANGTLEKRLWDAAHQFRANSGLKAQEYSSPVLGLIFLRYADVRFAAVRARLDAGGVSSRRASRVDDATAYHAEGVLFLSPEARFEHLLSVKIRDEVEPKTLLFTGESLHSVREDVIANFDAKAYRPKDDCRILVATEVLAEGVNLHRSNVVINYDIPWNPTRLIQRVGRVNRVDTKFDKIHTYNFFPTDEGNDLIKLREAAEAKIHAFIQMLGADARLLTEGEGNRFTRPVRPVEFQENHHRRGRGRGN